MKRFLIATIAVLGLGLFAATAKADHGFGKYSRSFRGPSCYTWPSGYRSSVHRYGGHGAKYGHGRSHFRGGKYGHRGPYGHGRYNFGIHTPRFSFHLGR